MRLWTANYKLILPGTQTVLPCLCMGLGMRLHVCMYVCMYVKVLTFIAYMYHGNFGWCLWQKKISTSWSPALLHACYQPLQSKATQTELVIVYTAPGLQVAHVLHTQWVQFCLITMRVVTACTFAFSLCNCGVCVCL